MRGRNFLKKFPPPAPLPQKFLKIFEKNYHYPADSELNFGDGKSLLFLVILAFASSAVVRSAISAYGSRHVTIQKKNTPCGVFSFWRTMADSEPNFGEGMDLSPFVILPLASSAVVRSAISAYGSRHVTIQKKTPRVGCFLFGAPWRTLNRTSAREWTCLLSLSFRSPRPQSFALRSPHTVLVMPRYTKRKHPVWGVFFLAHHGGLEPSTPSVGGLCSIHLG